MSGPAQLQAEFDAMVRQFELLVRPRQKAEFDCCSQCAGNMSLSGEEFQRCVLTCGKPLEAVQRQFKTEVESFERKFTRCGAACKDAAEDAVRRAGSLTPEIDAQFKACADQCTQTATSLLPAMLDAARRMLDQ